MAIGGIESSKIQSMINQIREMASKPSSKPFDIDALTGNKIAKQAELNPVSEVAPTSKSGFLTALRSSIDAVNNSQSKAEALGKQFALGDDSVSLSDVMIAGQKANISFQSLIQVRNKVVAAYQDVMSMQV